MKKYILIFQFVLCWQGISFSQKGEMTLNKMIQKAQQHFQLQQLDSTLFYSMIALNECEENRDRNGMADCFHLMAKATYQKKDIPLALRYYLQTLKLKEANRSEDELSRLHFELADVYESWSVHGKAIQHYLHTIENHKSKNDKLKKWALSGVARNYYLSKNPKQALKYHEELKTVYEVEKDQKKVVETLGQIIKIYKEQGHYDLALQENLKVLAFNEEQKDTAEIIVALNNLGVLQRQLNRLDDALNYFIRSADMQMQFQADANPTTLTNIGILYQNQKKYQASLRYLFDGQDAIQKVKPLNVSSLSGIENLIAIVYLSMNDLNNAYKHNEQAIVLAQSINDKTLEYLAYKTRADIYEQFNDFEQALSYFQKYTGIKDSLLLKQQAAREQNLLKQFSAEQTEKEISLLVIDREIEDLKYQQDLLENEKLRQEQALQQSLLIQERLEKEQAEQALQIAQQALEKEKSEQQLYLTQQQLEAEQKDRQIAALENEQTTQALKLAEQNLEVEKKNNAIAEAAKAQAELELTVREKNLTLENQAQKAINDRQTTLRNVAIGFLTLSLIILGLLYRTSRIKNKANKILSKQKAELETVLANLQQTQSKLLQSEKMASLGQLTAGVAHEINNPINFITTSVDALKYDVEDLKALLNSVVDFDTNQPKTVDQLLKIREQLDVPFLKEEVGELINNIEIGANRTHDIVMALRTYSRDTSEKFIAADIHEGIDSSLIILNHKKGDKITIHKNYGEIPMIPCMASRLNQVFLNILDNAIQAVEGEGNIYISTTQNNKQTISIRFRDSGKGMDEEVSSNAFNPFFTTKEVGAGTGLGLYVSYNIIQQHNGTISINSEKGVGTEFVIVLPIWQEEAS